MPETPPHTEPRPEIRVELPRRPESATRARHETRAALTAWQVPEAVADNVAAVTTELVTNALIHAAPHFWHQDVADLYRVETEQAWAKAGYRTADVRLTVRLNLDHVLVQVCDTSPADPCLRAATSPGLGDGHLAEWGRGLYMVQILATVWGVRDRDEQWEALRPPAPYAKTVWAAFSLRPLPACAVIA